MFRKRLKTQDLMRRLERCAELHADRGWRLALSITGNASDADEVMQQAFTALAANPARIPEDLPWPWFATVLTNAARNLWRSRSRQRQLQESLTIMQSDNASKRDDPSALLANDELAKQAQAALQELPAPEREALSLTLMAGLTQSQAAQALGIPLGTLKTNARRGMEQLRHKLNALQPDMNENQCAQLLSVAPLALPPGGLAAASAKWITGATSSAATSAAAGVTSTGIGIAAMSKSMVAAAGIAGGILIGVMGTSLIGNNEAQSSNLEGVQSSHADTSNERSDKDSADQRGGSATAEPAKSQPVTVSADDQPADSLKNEVETWKSRALEAEKQLKPFLDAEEARRKAEERLNALEPQYVSFGDATGMPELNGESLKKMAEAIAYLNHKYHEQLRFHVKGEEEPNDLAAELNVARTKAYDALKPLRESLAKRFPTVDVEKKAGVVETHPLLVANVVLAQLALEGIEATPDQVEDIQRFGEAYQRDWEARQKSYPADELLFQKLFDEFDLKLKFFENMMSIMTPKQKDAVAANDVAGLRKAYFFTPTSLLSPLTIRVGMEVDLRDVLIKNMGLYWGLSYEFIEQNVTVIDQWLSDVAPLLEPQDQLKPFSYAEIRLAGQAQLRMLRSLASGRAESDPHLEKIRKVSEIVLMSRMTEGNVTVVNVEW